MKLKVGDLELFKQWRSSAIRPGLFSLHSYKYLDRKYYPYADRSIRLLDVEVLLNTDVNLNIVEIDALPETKIKDLIVGLTGEENLTYITEIEEITWGLELGSKSNDTSNFKKFKKTERMIHTRCLYCLSATEDMLDPAKTVAEYDIQEGDLLLLGEHIKREKEFLAIAEVIFSRDIIDFCDMVRTEEDIEADQDEDEDDSKFQTYPPRTIKSVLLYTDEDADLAQYIRYHFAALNEMTNHHLNIYTIEQPTKVRGISANEYWKAMLEQTKYSFLQLMGWTRYKPYNKADAYKIASRLGVYPDALPCIVIFRDINNDEKIVVFITGEFQKFFRGLSSVVIRTLEKLSKSKVKLDKNFDMFKSVFMENWNAWQKEVEEKKEQTTTFTFNGKTVFINRPSGQVEIKDFQND